LQALRDRDHVILIRKRPRRPESARSKAPSKA
jgi:hypothetical protein